MADKEMVLKIGIEGGGATIFRTLLDGGGYQFHVEGSSMYLDENDDEGWRTWANEPFQTIQGALRSISTNGSWVLCFPVSVHPEYRTIIWALAQEVARKLSGANSTVWERRREDWLRKCVSDS